ncbi:hypothetical protein CHA01nite_20090 [Chryseobacterium hagamense]|uniref:SMP-30/Gluconolactonase/LRE-like region domain-containing protein n=2 Tax=Chryseobacterium hagamense TaxID=395935 RepID=A0A511YM41_9FLAO|nr:hypothetical protein CHA01nite_20090 [Chryseobacterium hagamense]
MVTAWTDFKIKTELPINGFAGFVVDSQQNIYIGDSFYSIIQKYDKAGKFIGSFKVKDTSGKPFHLSIDTRDNIVITRQRDRKVIVYPSSNREESFSFYADETGKMKEANTFFITRNHEKYGNLGTRFPAIWKLSGTKEKIVEQSLFLRLLSFPSMIVVILTAVILKLMVFITEKWRKLRSGT